MKMDKISYLSHTKGLLNVHDELYKSLDELNATGLLDPTSYKKVHRAIERNSTLKSGGIETQKSFHSHFSHDLHRVEQSRRMLFITNKVGFAIIFYDLFHCALNLNQHIVERNSKDLINFAPKMHSALSLAYNLRDPDNGPSHLFLSTPTLNNYLTLER